jgi:hypothetical protein
MSETDVNPIKNAFFPAFSTNYNLYRIGEYLYDGFQKGLLEERVKEKNYSYGAITIPDDEKEHISPVVLMYFINMGTNVYNILRAEQSEKAKKYIDAIHKSINFEVMTPEFITIENLKRNFDALDTNLLENDEKNFKTRIILDGGEGKKSNLYDFFRFGYEKNSLENQRKIMSHICEGNRNFMEMVISIQVIDPTYKPTPEQQQDPALPSIHEVTAFTERMRQPLAQQQPSAQPSTQPQLAQQKFDQPPPINPRDTRLLIYDLPSKRVIKYNPKNGEYELYINGNKSNFATEGDRCFGTNYNDCPSLKDILENPSDEKLLKALQDGKFDFNTSMGNDFSRMDPKIAMKLLKQFGFDTVKIYNGQYRFQTVDEWLNELSRKGIDPTTIQSIRTNSTAIVYIENLVDYVNRDPKILNHDYPQSQESSSQYLRSLGIKPLPPIKLIETQHRTGDTLLQMANVLKQKHVLSNNPMLYHPFPVHVLPRPQFGGGEKSNKLRFIINGLIKDLESRGKRLSDKDRTALMSNLDMLEQLEDNLEKISQKLTQYRGWSDTIPDRQPEVVSVGLVEDKLAKYKDCVRQQQKLEKGLLDAAKRLDDCLKS